MTSRSLIKPLLVAALALLAACASPGPRSPAGTTTTVVLLRHADRHPMQDGLNEAGRVRAAELPAALADLAIDAIYTLDIKRNRETAEPLATARGLAVRIVAERGIAERLLRENAGKTVVWIGNTDNLSDIHRALGGDGPPPERYGEVFVLRVPDRGATVVSRRHFGAPPAGQ